MTIKSELLTKKYFNFFSSKFEILDIIEFKEFDYNFDILIKRLQKIKKEEYSINQKIIIEHFDTDYYDDNLLKFGLNLYNFFQVTKKLNLPNFIFLFVTNHFGLKDEIDKILNNNSDKVTVIETFITKSHYNTDAYHDIDVDQHKIVYPALTMMNHGRCHRYAFYDWIEKNSLLDYIEISIRK